MNMLPARVFPARRQLRDVQHPGTPFGELDDDDGRLLAQFAMRAKMSPVRADYGLDVHRVVIQDFLGCVEDEVSVQRGDCVRELFRDGHWMFVATTAGQTGFIPATYCKPISTLINSLPQNKSNTPSASPSISRRGSESSSVFHLTGSRHSLHNTGLNNTSGTVSDSSGSPNIQVRRRGGAASPSRLMTHGINPPPTEWHGTESTETSRAPSRSQTIRNRISLLAALGEDDLAKQRKDLTNAAGMMTPGSEGTTPEHSSSNLNSPGQHRLSQQYGSSYDSNSSSPLVSPGRSLDAALAASTSPRHPSSHLSHTSQHDIVSSPHCPRRVTGRGRQSRRTSIGHEPVSRPDSQASMASLPAVQRRVSFFLPHVLCQHLKIRNCSHFCHDSFYYKCSYLLLVNIVMLECWHPKQISCGVCQFCKYAALPGS